MPCGITIGAIKGSREIAPLFKKNTGGKIFIPLNTRAVQYIEKMKDEECLRENAAHSELLVSATQSPSPPPSLMFRPAQDVAPSHQVAQIAGNDDCPWILNWQPTPWCPRRQSGRRGSSSIACLSFTLISTGSRSIGVRTGHCPGTTQWHPLYEKIGDWLCYTATSMRRLAVLRPCGDWRHYVRATKSWS